MTWEEVSSYYSGVFFRVVGGNATKFGEIQEDNVPHVVGVNTGYAGKISGNRTDNNILPIGNWSDWSYTGASEGTTRYTRFRTSGGEVRPKNMAVRVWKSIEIKSEKNLKSSEISLIFSK